MIDTSELTQNITVLAEQQGLSELEVITLLQTGAAASGEEELLDALCYLKRKYIPTVTEQENFYSPTTEHPEKDLPQSPPPMTMAERKYWKRHEEVTRLLERAQELVDAHAEAATAGGAAPNFSHAGDLLHVQQLLDQLIAFLSSDGE